MHATARSYLTAGVAALGAGAVALTPIQPLPSQGAALPPALTSALAVNLTASFDPITPWVQTIQTSVANISTLINAWAAQPFPVVQQVFANLGTYVSELPAVGVIVNQMVTNLGNAAQAPFAEDLDTLDAAHTIVYDVLKPLLPDAQGVLDFTSSPVSGLIMGFVGPVMGPLMALVNSVTNAIAALQSSDWIGALNELVNIPATVVNTFLNGGQVLDLTSALAPLVPAPSTLNSATIGLGGLLSPGSSLFNTIGVDASYVISPRLPGIPLFVPAGPGAGILGSLIAMPKAIARAIVVTPVVPAAAEVATAAATASPTRPARRSVAGAAAAKSTAKPSAAQASRRAG